MMQENDDQMKMIIDQLLNGVVIQLRENPSIESDVRLNYAQIESSPPASYATLEHILPSTAPRIGGRQNLSTYEIYRSFVPLFDSESELNLNRISRNINVPPSYSTIIKTCPPQLDINQTIRSVDSQNFSRRIPPPSYAQAEGIVSGNLSEISSEQIVFGPDPLYVWCSRCNTVVITVIQPKRSKFTHFTAFALCIFGCWPCCLLPYFTSTCKTIYHYCPNCNFLFGLYNPW